MPSQPPLPHLLTPYICSPPPSSLTTVSSVLDATGNWLVLRFLCAALNATPNLHSGPGIAGVEGVRKKKVVLVSFLRGWEFWRSEAKRLGLDLARLTEKRQFAFVDGLSELFSPPTALASSPAQPHYFGASSTPRTTLPTRSHPGITPHGPSPPRQPAPSASAAVPSHQSAREASPVKRLRLSGSGTAAIDALEMDITAVINQLKTSNLGEDGGESDVLLIVDQPDLLLAATGPNKGIGATEMGEWIMGLQQAATATVVTVSSDSPLIHNASAFVHQTATPLETEHAAFTVGLAYRAEMVMQLRNLETGAARDVSGVLRVSKGGAWGHRESAGEENWEEKEVLYFVQRDGGVSMFGRGE
ncbi:hypothetical protein ASPSYDRAFT_147721 [Aspergillus sydowii CBS 593.65]|uniref:Elongator complex protein 6 n=1 Tax=Aspergillus sydowii CBS 593.65 TaxID=1036612 RepID=A0A1L9TPC5_9EURO|nr:uncharacterized protein ASPSYDRAFT_147721 [Aspergillus sydowii CBS 593.65]OJJ61277.1 hypothetical protein ASPSYDRAFT_147721 [Aspergillus sydowii CBS 593.65]